MEKTKMLGTLVLALFLICGLATAAKAAQMAAERAPMSLMPAYMLRVGGAAQTAHFSVVLVDVGIMQGENGLNPAVFEIRGRNGNLIDSILVSPGFSRVFPVNDQNQGYTLTIRVHATGNAINRADRWATMSVVEARA